MTVSNEGREKVHMAMTADGNSRFRDGSLGLLVRVDNDLRRPCVSMERHGGRGSTDLRASMTRAARTATHGDDRRRRLAGRGHDADEKFDGVSGDWSDALPHDGQQRGHMAMTADGNSRFLALRVDASITRTMRRSCVGHRRLERHGGGSDYGPA